MDNAQLHLGFRKDHFNGIRKASQIVTAGDSRAIVHSTDICYYPPPLPKFSIELQRSNPPTPKDSEILTKGFPARFAILIAGRLPHIEVVISPE